MVNGQAQELLLDAVWRNRVAERAARPVLAHTLALARRNQVSGQFARCYPDEFPHAIDEVDIATRAFDENLREATALLWGCGVQPVLIKDNPAADCLYADFDLVIPPGRWADARRALRDWSVRRERYWLERSAKELHWPATGPAAHLHAAVSWFGVDIIPAAGLAARSRRSERGTWLVPAPEDQIRIWLGHALFQNLAVDLSELLALRRLLDPDVVARASRLVWGEGWEKAFASGIDFVRDAVLRLDSGDTLPLPLPVPTRLGVSSGIEHAVHALRARRTRSGLREAALRGPLVLAKRRRLSVARCDR